MKVVCASTSCKYSSEREDSSNIIFISFPSDDTAKIWAHNCGRLDLLVKPNEDLHSNYFVCSHHLEDQFFINKSDPIVIAQGAIPTLFEIETTTTTETCSTIIKKSECKSNVLRNNNQPNNLMYHVTGIEELNHATVERDYQNIDASGDLNGEKNNTMFAKGTPIESMDSNTLTYCILNTDIDEYNHITVGFSSLCRLCGDDASDGIEIFTGKGAELKLKDKIGLHMPISVNVDDVMPQRLCTECYNKLEIAHALVMMCLQTDMRFRKFLNINGIPQYDSRFDALVEECLAEINRDSCNEQAAQDEGISFVSGKDDEKNLTYANKIEYQLGKCLVSKGLDPITILPQSDDKTTKFESGNKNEIHSALNDLFQVLKDGKNKDNIYEQVAQSTSERHQLTDKKGSAPIICLLCKEKFKTQEMFKNHKILCDVSENLKLKTQRKKSVCSDIRTAENESSNSHCGTKTCNLCKAVFETETSFNDHQISRCKSSEQSSSQTCNQTLLNDSEDVDVHEDLHVHINELIGTSRRCGYCEIVTYSRKELQNHISEIHGGQTLFKCSMCDKAYEKWSSLDVHEATHRLDKPFLCDLCGKSFKHSNNLRGHKRIHLDESKKKRHVCEICGNAFRSRFHLSEHMNQHKGNKPYTCEQCGKAFYKRIQLRQHKLSHGLNKYACPICGVTFNRRGNMNTHLKRHNNGEGVYTCSVCECRCKSMSELKMHRKEHSERDIVESVKKKSVDKRVWQCRICARVFSKHATWSSHERAHGGEKINVECDECGKKLASKSSLAYHKKAMHSTERPHMCQFCGESFVSKEARLIHERIHTGERPYACKQCNMQYRCSSNLSQHMKIHLETRPHVCQYCNKGFTRKGALTVHERIHTGVKPFACSTCGRTFSQKNDMLKHTKTHRFKSMQCEQCNEVFSTKRGILKHMALHEQEIPDPSVIEGYVEAPQELEPYTINIPYPDIDNSNDIQVLQSK